jgi:DHA2 family multidrug resistance protein
MTTIGGTVVGSGVISSLVTEREKFHSNVITESVSQYDSLDSDHITRLDTYLAQWFVDDAGTTAQAISLVASQARREAWVLAFNDGFIVITALLVISAFGVIAIGPAAPLRRRHAVASGERS